MAVQAPFKKDGGLWFMSPSDGHMNLVWQDIKEFTAELKLVSFQRTAKGSFYLMVDEETNATYPISCEEMCDMLLKAIMEDGYVQGRWTFVQRGSKYSLRLVQELMD